MSLRDLAATIGITEQGLQKLIRENSTKVDTLEAIASALGVSPAYFFAIAAENTDGQYSVNWQHQGKPVAAIRGVFQVIGCAKKIF